MKVVLVALLVAVTIAVVSAKSCKNQDDCDSGTCCMGYMPFRGTCKAMTKEGGKCRMDEAVFPWPPSNEIYIVSCPCDEGLECHGEETSDSSDAKSKSKKEKEGKCISPPTEEPTTAEPSEETSDAPSDEVTENRPGEVTKDQSGEVTKDQSGEVTSNQSGEQTAEPSQETTDGEPGEQ